MRLNKRGRIVHLLNMVLLNMIYFSICLIGGYFVGVLINEQNILLPLIIFGIIFYLLGFISYGGIEYGVTKLYNYINDTDKDEVLTDLFTTPYIKYMHSKYKYYENEIRENLDYDYQEALEEVDSFLGVE